MATKTIRRVKPKQFYAPPFMVDLETVKLADGTASQTVIAQKVQLIRCGTFFHEQYGKLEITPTILKAFVKNFTDKVRKIDLAIDYKHESEDVAAGWIKNIYFDDNSNALYAEIDWTSNGKRVLIEKEFRYVSAEFNLDYQDSESLRKYGPTLLGAGLTNRPFIKGMEPVVPLSEGENMSAVMTPEEMTKAIQGMQAALEKLGGNKEADEGAEDDEAKGKDKPAPAADDGKGDEKDLAEANAALKKQLADMSKKCDDLMAAKGKEDGDKAASEKKKKFDLMLSEGKAVEAQRASFMSGDLDAFTAQAKPLKDKKISLSEKEAGATDEVDSDPQKQLLKLADGLVADKKAPDKISALSMVLHDPKNKALKESYEKRSYNIGMTSPVAEE